MLYFKSPTGEVFGYDEEDPSQLGLIAAAKKAKWPEITDNWPPAPSAEDLIKIEIAKLEATITPRRLREAVLGSDGGWLKSIDEQISALRGQLQ